jgi:CBS domain-containing protein
MRVGELMQSEVRVVEAGVMVDRAARRMRDAVLDALPVVAAGELVGMLTTRDLAHRVVAAGRDPATTPVGVVMTPRAETCLDDEDVDVAVLQMLRRSVRRLVVIDRAGQVAGLLSVEDLALVRERPDWAAGVLRRIAEVRAVELDGLLDARE